MPSSWCIHLAGSTIISDVNISKVSLQGEQPHDWAPGHFWASFLRYLGSTANTFGVVATTIATNHPIAQAAPTTCISSVSKRNDNGSSFGGAHKCCRRDVNATIDLTSYEKKLSRK